MDYTAYFSAPPSQPFHGFMGMPPTSPFPHTGVDPDTVRSIVSCSIPPSNATSIP